MNSKLFRGTVSLLLNTGLVGILGFIFWKIAAGIYEDASQIGQATTMIAVTAIASTLATSGINPHIMLSLSNKGTVKSFAKEVVAYQTISGIAAAVISASIQTVLIFVNNFEFIKNPFLFISVILMSYGVASTLTLDFALLSTAKSITIPIKNVGSSILKIVFIYSAAIMFSMPADENIVFSTMLAVVILNFVTLKATTGKWVSSWGEIKTATFSLKNKIGHHQFTGLSQALPPFLIPLIITGAIGTAQSAIFSIVWLIGSMFFTIAPSVANALLSDAANQSYDEIKKKIRNAYLLSYSLLTPAVLIAVIFNETIMGFFGEEYTAGATLLAYLSLAVIFDTLTNIVVAKMRLNSKLKEALVLTGMIGLTIILLSAMFIPIYGINVVAYIWAGAHLLFTIPTIIHSKMKRLA